MGKFTFLLIHLFSLLFLGILQQPRVSIQMEAPVVVDAGSEFRVRVTVDKENLEGFARFQQILPAGLTAIAENSSTADFTFKPKRVRLIWLRLPDDEQITVVYRIKVDERLKGNFDLGGRFSYIDNNERKSARIISQNITIIPSPDIDPTETIDIQDFEKQTIPNFGIPGTESITSIRQKPYTNASGEIVVNLLVNKLDKEKFAKIEEQVPDGFTAVSITTKDAIFTYKDNVAKFLWMNLPLEKYYVVTYNLIADAGKSLDDLYLKGKFSYIEGDKTMVVDITEKDVDLVNITDENLAEILSEHKSAEPQDITPDLTTSTSTDVSSEVQDEPKVEDPKVKVPENPTSTVTSEKEENTNELKNNQEEQKTEPKEIKSETELIETKKQEQEEQTPVKPDITDDTKETPIVTEPIVKKEPAVKKNKKMLQPENGVYYRVQVAAGHKPVNIDRYFKRLKLEADVKRESHEGWLKYSVGSFDLYKDARDYRVHVWNTTEINDAFVAAYNDGNRITVQEALMIANQNWYK